jgi:NAD-dependent DNA ligase
MVGVALYGMLADEVNSIVNVYNVRNEEKMTKATNVSVRVDENTRRVLEALASGRQMTLSRYINILLEKHVAEQPKESILQSMITMQEQQERERKVAEQATGLGAVLSSILGPQQQRDENRYAASPPQQTAGEQKELRAAARSALDMLDKTVRRRTPQKQTGKT